jgi:hypothetical protein
LDITTGAVISKCWPRHRAIEFRKFLDQIYRAVPADLMVHLVLDNFATHKTKEIRAWFLQHPRYHLPSVGAKTMSGLQLLTAIMEGTLPAPPILRVMDFRITQVKR